MALDRHENGIRGKLSNSFWDEPVVEYLKRTVLTYTVI